ncbi:Hypothetical protein NTJ_13889 [Nesidiocoris tenuis]|uniref:Uncharacterized protein n=1 Tax=Nesidiocoris tenuis TaxID=355587 RepID=A0ABN7BBN6_9HEMI|nr:Hypothetical protein NTJ_13889 [Nesidiocoris tenuis]
MLSISSFLNPDTTTPAEPLMIDRGEHYSYHKPWKGGGGSKKKGSQTALSALTLLAFLFFLNMLQQCLQDQMQNNAPIIVMMTTTTTTTTTTEGQRQKREDPKTKGETQPLPANKVKPLCTSGECEPVT